MLRVMKCAPIISAVLRFVILHARATNWEFICFLVRAQAGLLPWESFGKVFPLEGGPCGKHLSGAGPLRLGPFPLSLTWVQ